MNVETNKSTSGVVDTVATTTPPDIESQQKQQQPLGDAGENPSTYTGNPDVGKGLGITMFVLLIIAFVTAFFIPIISFICLIATIIIASVLTGGCCCASDYSLQPSVKKLASGTLVWLALMLITQIIWLNGLVTMGASEASETGTITRSIIDKRETLENSTREAGGLNLLFNVMAIIFSALVVCAQRS